MINIKLKKIAIIGLGYVGFPLFNELSKYFTVVGYDHSLKRVNEIKNKKDFNKQIIKFENFKNSSISNNPEIIRNSNVYIVTVPTPIYRNKKPNLSYLKSACNLISNYISNKSLVIFESTTYPGCTEEFCRKLIEKNSKFKYAKNDLLEKKYILEKKNFFYLGYSPERINPGDSKKNISNINKVISASTKSSIKLTKKIYGKIIKAKIFTAKNIITAEAAKIIENTQRDLNIGLFNEFSKIFKKLNINTKDVIEAASTKWNFHTYNPGLVGGHCIGVDPYYLTYISRIKGYNPNLILAARNLNDSMHEWIIRYYYQIKKEKFIKGKNKILILGYTFKDNCPDIRNSRVVNLTQNLIRDSKKIYLFDPVANEKPEELKNKKNVVFIKKLNFQKIVKKINSIFICCNHKQFKSLYKKISILNSKKIIIIDIKRVIPESKSDFVL